MKNTPPRSRPWAARSSRRSRRWWWPRRRSRTAAAGRTSRPSPRGPWPSRSWSRRRSASPLVWCSAGSVAQRREDRRHVVGADHLRAERAVLLGAARPPAAARSRGSPAASVSMVVKYAREPGVDLVAVGQVGQPAPLVGPRVRGDLVAEHVAVALGRGPHLLLHDGSSSRSRQRAASTPGGRVLHGEHRVLLDRRRQPAVELLDGLPHREVGRGAAGRDALAVPVGEVVEVAADALELADHRLGDVGVRAPPAWARRPRGWTARRRSGWPPNSAVRGSSSSAREVASQTSIARVIRRCSSSPSVVDRLRPRGERPGPRRRPPPRRRG